VRIRAKIIATVSTLTLILCSHGAALSEPQHPLFYPKRFYDVGPNGDTVSAEGALPGEDVAYKNNRVSITCFKLTKECWIIRLETQGNIVFDFFGPISYEITECLKVY
jgi:hypothetical protein